MDVPAAGTIRVQWPRLRPWCWNVAVGRPGNGTRRQVGGGDPDPLLPGDRAHQHRRGISRRVAVVAFAAAAWTIGVLTWTAERPGYDFVAFYAAARLVATGSPALVTDPAALLVAEHDALPERTILLNDPNPPALALIMAPLGLLPIDAAFAVWTALAVAALTGAAYFLGRLVDPAQRGRLVAFALLAPTSLIALPEGQTTPFALLAV